MWTQNKWKLLALTYLVKQTFILVYRWRWWTETTHGEGKKAFSIIYSTGIANTSIVSRASIDTFSRNSSLYNWHQCSHRLVEILSSLFSAEILQLPDVWVFSCMYCQFQIPSHNSRGNQTLLLVWPFCNPPFLLLKPFRDACACVLRIIRV